MKDILEQIVADKRIEIAEAKKRITDAEIHRLTEIHMQNSSEVPSLRRALLSAPNGCGIIAEFKRKSPSKGWIKEEGRADIIPQSYEDNGAAAVSILTDYNYFGGKDEFVSLARNRGLSIPVLYKNFVIDEYQLFQARLCGASAILLIAADLTKDECKGLIRTAHELGLEVLLEMHNEAELEYAELEPDVCGINNRNLGSFVTDVNNSFRLAERLPNDAVKVSESGISNPAIVRQLMSAGFHGFLIGECFMREENPGLALKRFLDKLTQNN